MPEPLTLNPKLETTPPSDPSHQCASSQIVGSLVGVMLAKTCLPNAKTVEILHQGRHSGTDKTYILGIVEVFMSRLQLICL